MGKGFIKSDERIVYDENGMKRVETTQKEFAYKTDEDAFYMVFIDFVKWMYGITSVGSLKLLPALLEVAKFNTGQISLTPGLRQKLMTKLDLSKSSFTRALNDLVENKAIFKCYEVDEETGEITNDEIKGEYIVNPEMFWKGDLKKRKELRVTFTSVPEE